MAEQPDYRVAIEGLKAKRRALDIAIAELEALSTGNPTSDLPATGAVELNKGTTLSNNDPEIRSDTFWGLSMAEASKKYLDMVKRPKSVAAIGTALKAGGNLSNSPHFFSILRNTLRRDTDFQKVKTEWGLSKWYSGRSIPVEPPSKPKTKKKKSVKPKGKEVVKSAATPNPQS